MQITQIRIKTAMRIKRTKATTLNTLLFDSTIASDDISIENVLL